MPDAAPEPAAKRPWPLRLAVGVLVPALFSTGLDRAVKLPGDALTRRIEFRLILCAFELCVLLFVVRVLERQTLRQSGLLSGDRLLRRFLAGCLLGAVPLLVVAGALLAGGYYSFSLPGTASLPVALGLTAVLLVAGFEEELRFRVLALRPLDDGLGSGAAMAISGLVFGLAHAGNDHATAAGVAVIAAGGVLLAALYLRFRSLWLPTGFHFAWNLTQGVILGLPISGQLVPSLLTAKVQGPEALTGGAFGAEASALTAVLVVVVTVAAVLVVKRAGVLTFPAWMQRLRGEAGASPSA